MSREEEEEEGSEEKGEERRGKRGDQGIISDGEPDLLDLQVSR